MTAVPRTGFIRSGFNLGIAAVIVILLAPLAMNLGNILGALPNPFSSERHERVQPPVLKSLQDLAEYHAATANLQAVVEVSHDADYLPSFIKGDDTKFLAVGSVEDKVVAVDGQPTVRPRMELTLTCDHRAVDGATGAEFLTAVKTFLEEPGLAL